MPHIKVLILIHQSKNIACSPNYEHLYTKHEGDIGPLNMNKGNQDEEKDFQPRLCKLNHSKNLLDHGFNIWCLQKMQGIVVQSLALHYAIFQNFGMKSKHLLKFSEISNNNN